MYFLFVLICYVIGTRENLPESYYEIEEAVPTFILNIACILPCFFAFGALAAINSLSDPRFKKEVSETLAIDCKFSEISKVVFHSPFFRASALIYAAYTLMLPRTVPQMAYYLPTLNEYICDALLIAVMITIDFFTRCQTARKLTVKKDFEKIKFGRADKKYGVLYTVGMSFLIYFISSLSVTVLLLLVSIFFIPTSLNVKDTLTILIPVIVAVVVLLLFKRIRALLVRRKFIKKLKKLCKSYNFVMSEENKLYQSVFHVYDGYNFKINANGKSYACKLVGTLDRGASLCFNKDGTMYAIHSLKLKMPLGVNARTMKFTEKTFNGEEIFNRTEATDFSFEADCPKLLIVNPIPIKIYSGTPEYSTPIDTGCVVGEYKIFNGTGFLNALERDCMEK